LPGTQRAVLMLRDVLQFSSAEVARILDTTPSAVNSALQRARRAVRQRVPEQTQQAELDALGRNGSRNLVDAFMRAWERADVAALVDLLAKDARFTMPPLPAWFAGQADIGRFFADRMFTRPWRLVPVRANGQPGFAGYRGGHGGERFRLAGINVLSVRSGRIVWIASFLDPDLHRNFDLPAELRPGDFRTER
jgi:ketosteroid isomerase-like protein